MHAKVKSKCLSSEEIKQLSREEQTKPSEKCSPLGILVFTCLGAAVIDRDITKYHKIVTPARTLEG